MPLAAQLRSARGRFTLPRPLLPFLRIELLAGLLVALALIPEAIAFSIIAGVDPRVCSPRSSWPARSRSSADARP
jgi:SulP family sulfate permease